MKADSITIKYVCEDNNRELRELNTNYNKLHNGYQKVEKESR